LPRRGNIFVATAPKNACPARRDGIFAIYTKNKTPVIMANTYTQLYTHLVFAVKFRQSLIQPVFREETERYMTGILQNKKHKVLAIYLMPDHAHVLIGQNPSLALSDTVQVLKTETSNFIKEKKFTPFRFQWQEGYGAFSHSRTELDNVIRYILNQPEHHKKTNV
jgi:REP element-mobilizing transposase RayT